MPEGEGGQAAMQLIFQPTSEDSQQVFKGVPSTTERKERERGAVSSLTNNN